MKQVYSSITFLILILCCSFSLVAQEKYDSATVAQIRDEGMNRSQVMEYLSYLSDVYAPRVTYSPAYKRAAEWELKELTKLGLENAHLESWIPMGKGWTLNKYSANVVGLQNWPLHSYPKVWAPGTKGAVTGEIIYLDGNLDSTLAIYKGKLKGKFVMLDSLVAVPEPFTAYGSRIADSTLLQMANADMSRPRGGQRRYEMTPERKRRFAMYFAKQDLCMKEGALGLLSAGRGEGGNIYVQNAYVPYSPDTPDSLQLSAQDPTAPKLLPQIAIATEQYNRLYRMLQKGEKPKLELNVDVTMSKPDSGYNIIADFPGTDLKDEVVIIGGHFDTWHGGTGATDDGTGVAVCMEAIRIMKALGLKPRRTIRVALWGGEEQGLIGSKRYVESHYGQRAQDDGSGSREITYLPEAENFDVYFNNDNGGGKVRGIYLQANEATRPIFRSWLRPFTDLGAATITPRNTGGTDHQSFDAINLPGFQFIQDPIDYWRTHHATTDVYERVIPEDLKQASVIMAAFAYNAAMRDEKFPRKPMPKPEPVPGTN